MKRAVRHLLAALPIGPIGRMLIRNRRLALEMARQEIAQPHAAAMLGPLWAFLHPLSVIGVHIFLFQVVFRVRMGESAPYDYAAYILSGLIPWLMSQEAINRAASSISVNATLVKKMVFPIEVLPAKSALAALGIGSIFLVVYLVYLLVAHGRIPSLILILPVVMGLFFMAMVGIGLMCSVLAVYFRDLPEVIRVFCLVNIYLMPVVYLPEWVPGMFRGILYANPFSHMIWCFQDVLYYGRLAHPIAWVVFPLLAVLSFGAGSWIFTRLRAHVGGFL